MIKEIIESMGTRIRSPLFGYYFFLFLTINWKPIFYVLMSDTKVTERISYFENATSIYSLLIVPIILAAIGAVAYPWINYYFLNLCKKPTELRNNIQAQSEHALIQKKQELEKIRNELLSVKETELIDRAKRDQELDEITDNNLKIKLKSEIEKLRKERDSFNSRKKEKNNKVNIKHLKEQLALHKEKANQAKYTGNPGQLEKAHNKIQELEEIISSEENNA